jgi:hypothetical protein
LECENGLGPETPELLGEAREDVWRTIEGRVAALPNLPMVMREAIAKQIVEQTQCGKRG